MIKNLNRFNVLSSIRLQLIISVALIHAVMMSLFILDLHNRQKTLLLQQQQKQAQFLATSLSHSSAGWLLSHDVMGLQEIIKASGEHVEDLQYAMAIDENGLILAHTEIARMGQYVTDLPDKIELTFLYKDAGLVDVVAPSFVNGEHIGWIRVGVSQSQAKSQVASLVNDGIAYTLFAILMGIIVASFIGTHLTRRLKVIGNTAAAIMQGSLSERVPLIGADEAEQLALRINNMLDALERNKIELQSAFDKSLIEQKKLNQAQLIAHLGNWEFNYSNQQFYASEEVFNIYGLDSSQDISTGEELMQLIHPDDQTEVRSQYQKSLLPGADDFDVSHRIVKADSGRVRYVRSKAEHIRDASGEVLQTAGIVMDISELTESSNRLLENEMRLRAILKTSSDAISIIDAEGTLVDASDSFLQERGYDESALGYLKVWDWDFYLTREKICSIINDAMTTEKSYVFETKHRYPNGSEFWVEIHVRGVHILNQNLVFASSRNIDERKKLQEQLIQSQKMESIGHLTGGIAHDFNNVLASILGFAELLKINLNVESENQKQSGYIGQIISAADRARELIAQMLLFSQQNQIVDTVVSPILLQPEMQEIITLLQASIPKTIEVSYQNKDETLCVCIQPVQLHQVLLNLVINARDAIGDYGHIDIKVQKMSLEADCSACYESFSGDFVQISVRDSGHGIPEHVLSMIFEPFFTTKEIGKGTGMGLSVIHGIVHSLDGHIQLSSSETGTLINIYLPLTQPDHIAVGKAENIEDSVNRRALSGLRIMLVDDEPVVAQMMQEYLTVCGATVIVYNQPAEAAVAFESDTQQVDLVITDETMPALSGTDMATRMLFLRPDLPIILCTGYSVRVTEQQAIKRGIAGFMYKPVDFDKLLSMIRVLCFKTSKLID